MTSFADYGIHLPPGRSGEVRTICPQCAHRRKREHQREKDLAVNTDTGVWLCMHCSWSGSLNKGDWRERIPRQKHYVKPEPPPNPTNDPKVIDWFRTERHIPVEVLDANHITSGPEFCPACGKQVTAMRFPYFRGGELVHVKYRCGKKHFWSSKDTERIVYNLDSITDADLFVVVEGEIDALSVMTAGFPHVVSVPDGAPNADSINVDNRMTFLLSMEAQVKRASKVLIATDMDANGERLAQELASRIHPRKCWRVAWPEGCKDANETLVKHGADAVLLALDQARPWPVAGIIEVADKEAAVWSLYRTGFDAGVSVGWPAFDAHCHARKGLLSVITGSPGSGKALALDTPIPTPRGWTTMGEIGVGDQVFDEQGKVCNVTRISDVMLNRPCYEVRFSDGTTVVCDADHQWLTRTRVASVSQRNAVANGRHIPRLLQPRGRDQSHKRTFPSVVTTAHIAETIRVENNKRLNHAVSVAEPIKLPDQKLPIDPYVLGAWLGDGTTDWGAFTTDDQDILREIEAAGHRVTKRSARYAYGIADLKTPLRLAGLLGNKHIPTEYLRGSYHQRLSLLQGLMDTDGYAGVKGACEFTSTSYRLASGVLELARTLGIRAAMCSGRATLNGRDCGPKYRVHFTTNLPVFRLQRKAVRLRKTLRPTQGWRYIESCTPVASVPVKCIEVDSPSHLYLCTEAFIPTHNSSWLDNWLVRLAVQHDWVIALYSAEALPIERHMGSLMAIYTGMPFNDGPTPRMSEADLERALAWLDDHFVWMYPDEPKVPTIIELAETLRYRRGISGLVIDPWNELDHTRASHVQMHEHVTSCLRELRRYANESEVAVWLVAHPTKLKKNDDTGWYPVATPYDIADSAGFFNRPDFCLSVWRNPNEPSTPTEVHIQKVRFQETGQVGMVKFTYDRAINTVREMGQPPPKPTETAPWDR